MHRSVLAVAAMIIGATGVASPTTPARAQEYPVCMHWKYDSVLCRYTSMAQCMATASGIGGDCILNPALAGSAYTGNSNYTDDEARSPRRLVRRRHHHHRYAD